MKKVIIIVFLFISIFICNKALAYEVYEIGDKVTYRNEDYYVIDVSNSKSNYVKLLKEKPLTVLELYKYGKDNNDELMVNKYVQYYDDPEKVFYEYSDDIGGMSYYTAPGCSSYYDPTTIGGGPRRDGSDCKNDYNESDVKKLIDNWSKDFQDDLVSIDGNKATLLTIDDLIENFGYEIGYDISNYKYYYPQNSIAWLFNPEYLTWIINEQEADFSGNNSSKTGAFYIGKQGEVFRHAVYNYGAVRPVIYLSKCALGDKDCSDCKR